MRKFREEISTNPMIDSEEKHLQLLYAIGNLDQIKNRLMSLIDRVQGNTGEPKLGREMSPPSPNSLMFLLNEGPSIIAQKIESIRESIAELEETLF